MNTLTCNAIALLVGALLFVPLSPPTARADDDDDDWEDRWEEFEDDWDDDDDGRWRRHGWYRPYGYREYYDGPRYYRHYRGPVYRDYYPERRVYRYYEPYPRYYGDYYGGRVRVGPADVYYGRHGAVRVGPLHVYW
jgi:hypothetical protein